ncbi:surface-adhesin E family protein [Acinetobacter junii]|uniref:surface-adhesin E family protein n=1 Tax=Acinetobacter junii TaxID=40215 RepID=UPI003A83F49F
MLKKLLISLLVMIPVITKAEAYSELKETIGKFSEESNAKFIKDLKNKGWMKVSLAPNSDNYYNINRMNLDGSFIEAWQKSIFIEKTSERNIGDYDLMLISYDCSNSKSALLKGVKYKKNGTVIDTHTMTYITYHDVVPETVGESNLTFVCAVREALIKDQSF